MPLSKCPNPICDGYDNCYMVDDLTPHKCDKCGTRWATYDPQERPEQVINIKVPCGCFDVVPTYPEFRAKLHLPGCSLADK
jgi:hypothetical protein